MILHILHTLISVRRSFVLRSEVRHNSTIIRYRASRGDLTVVKEDIDISIATFDWTAELCVEWDVQEFECCVGTCGWEVAEIVVVS